MSARVTSASGKSSAPKGRTAVHSAASTATRTVDPAPGLALARASAHTPHTQAAAKGMSFGLVKDAPYQRGARTSRTSATSGTGCGARRAASR